MLWRTERLPLLLIGLVFVTAGCSRRARDHGEPFPTEGLRFFAAAHLTGGADSVLVSVTARNDAGAQRVVESNICGDPLVVRVYREPGPRRGPTAPAWDSALWRRATNPPNPVCLPVAAVTVLAPGDSAAVAAVAFPVRAVLGDSLPVARYRLAAEFHGELEAGTMELRPPST